MSLEARASCGRNGVNLSLVMRPPVLYRIQVRRVSWPLHNGNSVFLKKVFEGFCAMTLGFVVHLITIRLMKVKEVLHEMLQVF